MKALFSFLCCWNKIFTLITSNWIGKVCVTKELSNVFNLTKESNQHGPSLSLSTSQSFNLFKLCSEDLYLECCTLFCAYLGNIDTIVTKVKVLHATRHANWTIRSIFLHFVTHGRRYWNALNFDWLRRDPWSRLLNVHLRINNEPNSRIFLQ